MRRELAEQRAEEESIAEERRAKSARKYEAPAGVLRLSTPQHARFAPSATQTSQHRFAPSATQISIVFASAVN